MSTTDIWQPLLINPWTHNLLQLLLGAIYWSTRIQTPATTRSKTQPPIIEGDNNRREREQENTFGTDGSTTNNTDIAVISPGEIAAIASVAGLLFVLAVIVISLAVGIVVYRRWKVEQVKKALLEIRPAHLTIGMVKWACMIFAMIDITVFSADNATYDLPMLAQHYRIFKSLKKGKAGGPRGSNGIKSTTSENIKLYESPYIR